MHTFPWKRSGLEILELLSENKVNLKKVYLCHLDVDIDIEYCKNLAESGVYIGFDCFGKEYYTNKEDRAFSGGKFSTDIERVRSIKKLIDLGFLSNILISSDICFKTMLHTYGGWGYDHILNNIISMMNEEGIPKDQIDTLLKVNPKVFLDV